MTVNVRCHLSFLFFVKVLAVYLFSILSFLILDLVPWIGVVEGGLTPIGFVFCLITRAYLADLISKKYLGIQSSSSKLRIDLVLAMLIFGVPIMSSIEILRSLSGIFIKIPLPPYVSLTQSTLIMALFYEFPRLILLIAIKRFLYGTRAKRGYEFNK